MCLFVCTLFSVITAGAMAYLPSTSTAQLDAEHSAVMELSSAGQWGKLTHRSVPLICARLLPSRACHSGCRGDTHNDVQKAPLVVFLSSLL